MNALASITRTVALASILSLSTLGADTVPGQVDFGSFARSSSGGEFVDVQLKGPLLSLAAKLAGKDDPDVAQLVGSLTSVHVNVVSLGDDNRGDVRKRLTDLRGQLDTGGWEHVVNVDDKDSHVNVYLKMRGTESVEGVVVMVEDGGKEAVLVNVVGDVKPEQLEKLGDKLNIKPLKHAGKAIKKDLK